MKNSNSADPGRQHKAGYLEEELRRVVDNHGREVSDNHFLSLIAESLLILLARTAPEKNKK